MGSSSGSRRYKVTARCVPEVSITSPTDDAIYYHATHDIPSPPTLAQQQQQQQQHPTNPLTHTDGTPPTKQKQAQQQKDQQQQQRLLPKPKIYFNYNYNQFDNNDHYANNYKNTATTKTTTIATNTKIPTTAAKAAANSSSNSNNSNGSYKIFCNSNINSNNNSSSKSKMNIRNFSLHNFLKENHEHNNKTNTNSIPIVKPSRKQKITFKEQNNISDNNENSVSQSGVATLVEEEDFNELTAVPTTKIVIATNATAPANLTAGAEAAAAVTTHQQQNHPNRKYLPPLKLTKNEDDFSDDENAPDTSNEPNAYDNLEFVGDSVEDHYEKSLNLYAANQDGTGDDVPVKHTTETRPNSSGSPPTLSSHSTSNGKNILQRQKATGIQLESTTAALEPRVDIITPATSATVTATTAAATTTTTTKLNSDQYDDHLQESDEFTRLVLSNQVDAFSNIDDNYNDNDNEYYEEDDQNLQATTITTTSIATSPIIPNRYYLPLTGDISRQQSQESDSSSQQHQNPTTNITTTYSHNSKTTRSWPVIYRNPQNHDYEALQQVSAQQQDPQQQQLQTASSPRSSKRSRSGSQQQYISNFHQNCYSNQFAQSILYSSSNEDLSTINESAENGGLKTSHSGDSNKSNHSNNKYYNNNIQFSQNNSNSTRQTTCYYFTSSRHNSIYDHPSAVVNSSLQHLDPSSAAVDNLRGSSNSVIFRNSSCSKIMQQSGGGVCVGGGVGLGLGVAGTPTSLTSGMDGVSGLMGGPGCCSNCCIGPPPVLFLFFTLLMTTSATAMLCAAIMTDHWEHVTWDRGSLDRYTNRSNLQLEWMLEDKVAMLKPDKRASHRFRRDYVFLVPMHGGIWTLCIDLPMQELQELRRNPKFPRGAPPCVNYLAGSMENAHGEEQRNDWQHSESQATLQPHLRMQNLSISCSLVCLIILGTAALVGTFGVCQRQISAILITGVMYLLAALFALFTLMIIHFKRQQGRPMLDSDYDGTVDGIVARPGGVAIMAKPLLGARIFLTSWSLDLGWGGVVLCAITSVLWILLSKIMRYNPLSALMI